jgi:hypothetical protein
MYIIITNIGANIQNKNRRYVYLRGHKKAICAYL